MLVLGIVIIVNSTVRIRLILADKLSFFPLDFFVHSQNKYE